MCSPVQSSLNPFKIIFFKSVKFAVILCLLTVQGLVCELLSNCDGHLKPEVAQMAAYYEHRLQLGSKAIYHLEAFVAKFMAIYKQFMEDGLDNFMFWFLSVIFLYFCFGSKISAGFLCIKHIY